MQAFEFEETSQFTKNWLSLGLTDENLQALQVQLMKNPEAGAVIPGTGGYRKIRVKLQGRGKRGGARVVYIVFREREVIELFNIYAKNQ